MEAKSVLIIIAALGLSSHAAAFEVKGYTPGMDIAAADLNGCEKVENADSGIPGFSCDTSLGGDPATLRIGVFEDKVVALIFHVPNARMKPTLDALSEKYGRPSQNNRYIEDYNWRRGDLVMGIKEQQIRRGYSLLVMSTSLFKKAQAAAAAKAKKEI